MHDDGLASQCDKYLQGSTFDELMLFCHEVLHLLLRDGVYLVRVAPPQPQLRNDVATFVLSRGRCSCMHPALSRIEVSASNRFLYHDKRGVQRPEGWTPPTRRCCDTLAAAHNALGRKLFSLFFQVYVSDDVDDVDMLVTLLLFSCCFPCVSCCLERPVFRTWKVM